MVAQRQHWSQLSKVYGLSLAQYLIRLQQPVTYARVTILSTGSL